MQTDIRMHVAFVLTELVLETVSVNCPRKRLLSLLWLAGTYSDETGDRAYKSAVRLMISHKIADSEKINKIVSGVIAGMEREKSLSRISP